MSLAAGSKLGPYEILAIIGKGGMGEVYRARDTKLGRDIALKVLPEAFARDVDRMVRSRGLLAGESQIVAPLVAGGMGEVYKARDLPGARRCHQSSSARAGQRSRTPIAVLSPR